MNNHKEYIEDLIKSAMYCRREGCHVSEQAYAERVFDLLPKMSQQYQRFLVKEYVSFFKPYERKRIEIEQDISEI